MSSSEKEHISSFCPKTRFHIRWHEKHHWLPVTWPIVGVVSLIWFLLRVIPKPSRAAYPCQRIAVPLASSFIVWIVGLTSSAVALHKARGFIRQSRLGWACICIAGAVLAGVISFSDMPDSRTYGKFEFVRGANPIRLAPVGKGKGIHPGRAVWVHDPDATDWAGPGDGHWWQEDHTNQTVVNKMMSDAVCALTSQNTVAASWDKLFRYFNRIHGKGNVGYRAGEKIMIKVNFVGFVGWSWGGVDPNTYELVDKLDYMNTSPQMMIALLGQLVNDAGVRQSDITIGDTTAFFANQYYKLCHDRFPNVHYLECAGKFGRLGAKPSSVRFHWSCEPKNVLPDYVPVSYVEADYFINMANLKSNWGGGITLCGKNNYGSLIRMPDASGYYDLHTNIGSPELGTYRTLVDLMGHPHIGGKTVLYLIDGLYAGRHPKQLSPIKLKMAPFNDDWSSSLFVSQDPVAIDSVGFDFLWTEWDEDPHRLGADDYLDEAAMANDPISGTFYDPDGDGKCMQSLGVHEHWNNSRDKQYSRNLGKNEGIELISLTAKMEIASAASAP